MELFQHTLAQKITLEGEGVLSGERIRVELCPAPPNHGLVIERADLNPPVRIPVRPENALAVPGAMVLARGPYRVVYVEHLLAALNGLAVDNLLIRVFGEELPLFDGSAKNYVEAILGVGRRPQWSLRRYIRLEEEIVVRDEKGFVALRPAEGLHLSCVIEFPHPAIGRQEFRLDLSQERFVSELSFARTFAFLDDLVALRKSGALRGGSLENAIVLDQHRVLNPDGLRTPDEFVRHKALDLVGDLYLLGAPLLAEVEAQKASHRLHLDAVKAVWEAVYAWRWYPSPAKVPFSPALQPAMAV
ncbi:MAG: UDP-3-O-[3-hydroxymyristoyl] N-acetylglucosamine deacetylase [Thermodesulfobacteria bacterium]|nr:UDP-3-O-[3-hydroxymyristoyl] N-acetylglucosamine deacetylase [Thermodesulfobacteriota bacterium]